MKKIAIILVCMLACFTLFTGCTNQKAGNDQETNLGNSVEIDDTDLEIDTEGQPDAEDNPCQRQPENVIFRRDEM